MPAGLGGGRGAIANGLGAVVVAGRSFISRLFFCWSARSWCAGCDRARPRGARPRHARGADVRNARLGPGDGGHRRARDLWRVLFGAIIPHDNRGRQLVDNLQGLVTALLLPAYFAFTGMRTQIALVSGWEAWAACLAIIAVATIGKFGGTLAAARLAGLGWRNWPVWAF